MSKKEKYEVEKLNAIADAVRKAGLVCGGLASRILQIEDNTGGTDFTANVSLSLQEDLLRIETSIRKVSMACSRFSAN